MHATSKFNRSNRRRVGSAALAGLLLASVGLAGCGDDDDSTAEEGSAATTTQALADNAAFCDGFVEADGYFANLDGPPEEAKVDELLTTITADAPAELSGQVEAVVAGTTASLATGGDTTPEYDVAHAEVGEWIGENCGFESLELTGTEYEFGGVPETAKAGTTQVSLKNDGGELHEAIFVRVNDDVSESVEEIAALPQEEAMGKVTIVGQSFAMPGESATGFATMDEPGRYGVICFIPQGLTPEVAATMESSPTPPEGAPHFTLGMINEFEVE